VPQGITILGSTGSIGVNTLAVVAGHPERYRVHALTANTRINELAAQCRQFQPAFAVVGSRADGERLAGLVTPATTVLWGAESLAEVAAAPGTDIVMAAIVGAAGLLPTLAAAGAGKKLLLANKEALVMAGAIFMKAVADGGATLVPVDSEHNAIYQCLPPGYGRGAERGVARLLLTASGGPLRTLAVKALAGVTPDQACAHPNWSMGRKISVDSATMMNKGLELIEACWLFNLGPERIDVLIHPQSIVHSLVEYVDGSVLAQLGNPDMRTPIAHALAWPERIAAGVKPLDLIAAARLDFTEPDFERFPCLALAQLAAREGRDMPAALNAANEVAVEAFLDGTIGFTDIASLVGNVLERWQPAEPLDLAAVQDSDQRARVLARQFLNTRHKQCS